MHSLVPLSLKEAKTKSDVASKKATTVQQQFS